MGCPVLYLTTPETLAVVEELKTRKEFKGVDFVPITPEDIVQGVNGNSWRFFYKHANKLPEKCALLWGSGFDHHKSLLISPNVPYVKSLADAHEDLGDFSRPLSENDDLNEHTHNAMLLLYDSNLKYLEVRGTGYEQKHEVDKNGAGLVRAYVHQDEPFFGNSFRFAYVNNKYVPVIHASFDLDVVHGFPTAPEWQDHATAAFPIERLETDLEQMCRKGNVTRLDVGGLHFPNEYDFYGKDDANPIKNKADLKRGIDAYAKLLRIFLSN